MKRSSLLSIVLLLLMGLVALRTYQLWEEGPWEVPVLAKEKPATAAEQEHPPTPRPLLASTKNIVDRNLFDPERGQGRSREGEAQSAAVQRIRNMVLLGTAIIGSSRHAILEESGDPRLPAGKAQPVQSNQIRLKLGDTIEGFKVSEIQERRVVLSRGAMNIEVALDYMRKVEEKKEGAGTPVPIAPRVPSTIPRRVPREVPQRDRE
ncbi:MAG: hypothetical protein ACREQW_18520 [Candidatus Binatia bacterium]